MLVLTRKTAECVRIGDDVVVKVIRTAKGTVKLGIEAPAEVRVLRGELAEEARPAADGGEKSGEEDEAGRGGFAPIDPEFDLNPAWEGEADLPVSVAWGGYVPVPA